MARVKTLSRPPMMPCMEYQTNMTSFKAFYVKQFGRDPQFNFVEEQEYESDFDIAAPDYDDPKDQDYCPYQ